MSRSQVLRSSVRLKVTSLGSGMRSCSGRATNQSHVELRAHVTGYLVRSEAVQLQKKRGCAFNYTMAVREPNSPATCMHACVLVHAHIHIHATQHGVLVITTDQVVLF